MKAEEARALAKAFKNDDTEKVLKKIKTAATQGDNIVVETLTESVRKDLLELGYAVTENGNQFSVTW